MTASRRTLTDGLGWTVRLREIRPGDHRALAGFDRDAVRLNDPRIGGYRHWATHRADAGDDFHVAIETLHNRTLVGSMWVQADPSTGRFSYGIGIGAQYRRCGYAADAVSVLLGFMFERCGYRRCEVSINGGNVASLLLHGEIRYPALMSITADGFAAHRPVLATARGPVRPSRGRHWRVRRRGRHWRVEPSRRNLF